MDEKDLELLLEELLRSPVAYHPIFAKFGGGVCAGILLSQLWYWTPRTKDSEGWIYKAFDSEVEGVQTWAEETGLTRAEYDVARKRLKARGMIEEKLKGSPPVLHYRVVRSRVIALVSGRETFEPEVSEGKRKSWLNLLKGKGGGPKAQFSEISENQGSGVSETPYTETTTETTSKKEDKSGARAGVGEGALSGKEEASPVPEKPLPTESARATVSEIPEVGKVFELLQRLKIRNITHDFVRENWKYYKWLCALCYHTRDADQRATLTDRQVRLAIERVFFLTQAKCDLERIPDFVRYWRENWKARDGREPPTPLQVQEYWHTAMDATAPACMAGLEDESRPDREEELKKLRKGEDWTV